MFTRAAVFCYLQGSGVRDLLIYLRKGIKRTQVIIGVLHY